MVRLSDNGPSGYGYALIREECRRFGDSQHTAQRLHAFIDANAGTLGHR